jgi:uracil-DNA glycosylase
MNKPIVDKTNVVRRSEIVDQSWTVEQIATYAIPPTWEPVFEDAKQELKDISETLQRDELEHGPFMPNKCDLFNAMEYTPLPSVKLVIIGQDPYYVWVTLQGERVTRANGLSFSVRPGDAVPVSLNNIYKELESCIHGFVRPKHGDLRAWARQGVLLLNSCLTVRPNVAGSHGDEMWSDFIKKVIKGINNVNPHCIYFLWGSKAQGLIPMLGENNIALTASHPSGFSANRGFFGCKHFKLANEILLKQGKKAIKWNLPPDFDTAIFDDSEDEEEQRNEPATSNGCLKKQVDPVTGLVHMIITQSERIKQTSPSDSTIQHMKIMEKKPTINNWVITNDQKEAIPVQNNEPQNHQSEDVITSKMQNNKTRNNELEKISIPVIPNIIFGKD